jgi:DNA-binding NarL/FixJ family response regulator
MSSGTEHVTARPTTIMVVDDHTTFAELLTGALGREADLRSVGVADRVEAAVRMSAALEPDVVVMDYHLPDGNGLDASERILAERPETRVVMLTGNPERVSLGEAARLGVCAFLPKDCSLVTLLDTIRAARRDTMVVHPSILDLTRSDHRPKTHGVPALTPREMDVLRLMAQGYGVSANARALRIKPSTCRGYVKAILTKMDAHSQLEAVAAATRLGMLSGTG